MDVGLYFHKWQHHGRSVSDFSQLMLPLIAEAEEQYDTNVVASH